MRGIQKKKILGLSCFTLALIMAFLCSPIPGTLTEPGAGFGLNAYINGSTAAENGTGDDYHIVEYDDVIEYRIKINGTEIRPPLPPTVPNPSFQPKATMPGKVNFENGSFEEPVIGGSVPAASGNGIYYNYFWQKDVPGWSTRPTHPTVPPDPYTYCVEFQKPQGLPSFAWYTPDGNQYAELNANVEGTLYQVCDTVPGTKVYYEFYHGAKASWAGNNTDVMNFYLRKEGVTTGGLQRVCSDSAIGPVTATSNYQWGHYTGSYVVPAGQTRTEFSFESVSTTSGMPDFGNYLDAIRLYTCSYMDLTLSNNAANGKAKAGDLVTYTIVAQNKGESDASKVTVIGKLPAGTDFAPGTVKVDGTLTGNHSYNPGTRELSVNVGAGATPSIGGFVKGYGSFSTDCEDTYTITFQVVVNGQEIAENLKYETQARVTHEDRYDTDSPPDQYMNYSNGNGFDLDQRHQAIVTDILPAGLRYVGHTNAKSSAFARTGQTCYWVWLDLPADETIVTVTAKVNPDQETSFVNHATLDVGGNSYDIGSTYHRVVPFEYEKNAYINGSTTASNGAEDDCLPVRLNDTILYEIKLNNKGKGSLPPTVSNPSFQPKAPVPGKINFINGSFEEPVIGGSTPAASGNGIYYSYFRQSVVPGWSTRPIYQTNDPYADCIEFQKPRGTPSFAWYTPDGNQYAELNANVEGTLYQVCDTVPDTKVYYEFYHGASAQVQGKINTDVMNFYLRKQGVTTGGLQRVCTDSAINPVSATSNYQWGHYTGSYVVPAGQTRTEFSFESVSTTSGMPDYGNYLDGIRFYTNSYMDLDLSSNATDGKARVGDVITYTIVAENEGESDASKVKVISTLPAGMDFVAGTVRVDGALTGNHSYNAGTRELSVNIGAGATASAGGFVKGDGSSSPDCNDAYVITFQAVVNGQEIAQNLKYETQAKVIYEDRYDTDTPPDQYTNYSNVDEFDLDQRYEAVITDVLPAGLTYISHTSPDGSIFELAEQTCTWAWDLLPSGETIVTVTAKAESDTEVDLINQAKIDVNGSSFDTNCTYHRLLLFLEVTVTKTVTGEYGDKTRQFLFTIFFEDRFGEPLAEDTTFDCIGDILADSGATAPEINELILEEGGKASFTLSHGQSLTVKEVASNGKIRIAEEENDCYITSFVDEKDPDNEHFANAGMWDLTPENRTFHFINTRKLVAETGITTGNTSMMFLFPLLIVSAILMNLAAKKYCRRRRQGVC